MTRTVPPPQAAMAPASPPSMSQAPACAALSAWIAQRLVACGVEATDECIAIGMAVFRPGKRHFTVDDVVAELSIAGFDTWADAVPDVLGTFASIGVVRRLPDAGARPIFDSDTSDHVHLLYRSSGQMRDLSRSEADALLAALQSACPDVAAGSVLIVCDDCAAPQAGRG
jgi:Fe2+ or Zn2+ uptake regulation protein